ncbi:Uncharacterised protein [Vibrio cholerae]|nr:Uncharacterised protein [Vibrio cholerae]CSI53775.1 Uncharacterised protein [Vibrio cholerae]
MYIPLRGSSTPARVFSNVVLPTPFSPMMATRSPTSKIALKLLNRS